MFFKWFVYCWNILFLRLHSKAIETMKGNSFFNFCHFWIVIQLCFCYSRSRCYNRWQNCKTASASLKPLARLLYKVNYSREGYLTIYPSPFPVWFWTSITCIIKAVNVIECLLITSVLVVDTIAKAHLL